MVTKQGTSGEWVATCTWEGRRFLGFGPSRLEATLHCMTAMSEYTGGRV